MAETYIWAVIQRWMNGQLVRSNQAALAEAVGVSRQAISQWKSGESLPKPPNLRRLHAVTQIPFSDLTDALLLDLGYTLEEGTDHGNSTATKQAGGSPAPPSHLRAVARNRSTPGTSGRKRQAQDEDGEAP